MSRIMFLTGRVVATRGVSDQVETDTDFGLFVRDCFRRYITGDWGDLGDDDKQMNNDAITSGEDRILARYNNSAGDIYIITEWDRSYTTILFTNEY